jgi:hypothetical protein
MSSALGTIASRYTALPGVRVGLTTRSTTSLSLVMDEAGNVYRNRSAAPAGIAVGNVFVNIVPVAGSAHHVQVEALVPGATITLGDVLARVVGVDVGEDFPVYVEAGGNP